MALSVTPVTLFPVMRSGTVTERLAARLDGVEAALHALDAAIRLSAEEQRAYVDASEARLEALITAWRAEWLGGEGA